MSLPLRERPDQSGSDHPVDPMHGPTLRVADTAESAASLAPAGVFAELARSLAEAKGMGPTLHAVVDYAAVVVPCDWAAVAVAASDRIGPKPVRLAASTDADLMATVAEISLAAAGTPGSTALLDGSAVYCPDLRAETRYESFATQIAARTPIRSVLSCGLQVRQERLGVLSVYSREANAFGDNAVERASLLADHAAIAIEAQATATHIDDLQAALHSNRVIGMALGILVERHGLTADTAFQVLRRASSYGNRKLALIAEELVETGHLPEH